MPSCSVIAVEILVVKGIIIIIFIIFFITIITTAALVGA